MVQEGLLGPAYAALARDETHIFIIIRKGGCRL